MSDISRETYDNLQVVLDQMTDERDAERALTDDLVAVLTKSLTGSVPGVAFDLSQQPDVRRALARYREARQQ